MPMVCFFKGACTQMHPHSISVWLTSELGTGQTLVRHGKTIVFRSGVKFGAWALHVMGADEQSCQHMPPRWTCDSQPSTFPSQKGDVKTGSCESYGLVADVKRECVSNTTRLFFLRLIRKQSRKRAPIHWIDSWNSRLAWKGLERKRLPQLNST